MENMEADYSNNAATKENEDNKRQQKRKLKILFRPGAEVEFIDGNCTHHVMLQLQELCPEIEECKRRKVFLYEKLSPRALSFLGLSRNDETSTASELCNLRN
uniref:Uncharacterized protein n=1 Tax=Magallana gigas TaxID=29159 RepID=A0A8W8P5H3_MAGGI